MSLKTTTRFLSLVAAATLCASNAGALQPSQVTVYTNPLLPSVEMADPHVLKVDGTYYLYATTHTRGYDVYESTNLVHWENKGSAFRDPRRGAWAPDVFHDVKGGKFYLYYTLNTQNPPNNQLDKVVGVAEADSPKGPFVDKGVLAQKSIDGHLFEDEGKFYFYYVSLEGGFKIMAQRMETPIKKQGEAVKVIEPTEPWEKLSGRVTEGPFMLKRGNIFYLTYSGTGADSPNYGIGYATSSSPIGPFKKHPGNPIVKRSPTILGPGHHSVVEGPDKELWLVYHQKWEDNTSFHRFLALDRIWFEPNGELKAEATRGQPRQVPMPSIPVTAAN